MTGTQSPAFWRCILLAAACLRAMDQTAAFFGAGDAAADRRTRFQSALLNRRSSASIGGLKTLALRNAAYRPGRSILCIAQIACATFLIVSVDAFPAIRRFRRARAATR